VCFVFVCQHPPRKQGGSGCVFCGVGERGIEEGGGGGGGALAARSVRTHTASGLSHDLHCVSFVTQMCTKFWYGNLKERRHLQNLSLDGRLILNRLLKKWDGKA